MKIEELFKKHQEYLFSLDSLDIKGLGGQVFRYKQALQQAGLIIRPQKQTKHSNPPKDLFKNKNEVFESEEVQKPIPKAQPSTLLADSGEKSTSKQEQEEAAEASQPKYRLSKADKALILEQAKSKTAEQIAEANNYSLTAVQKVING